MERPSTPTPTPTPTPSSSSSVPSLKHLSPQEWESLVEDYQKGRFNRWASSHYTDLPLLDLTLSSFLRKDFSFSLKHQLILFIEEFSLSFLSPPSFPQSLTRLLHTLRILFLQTPAPPVEPISITVSLKDQLLVSTSSVFICLAIPLQGGVDHDCVPPLEGLVELLLSIVNRPNHGPDRQTRSVACECLRELERACPCLLSQVSGHLWGLAMGERTHACQSYVLLLATAIHGIVMMRKPNVSIINTSTPLVPFNVPPFLIDDEIGGSSKEISDSGVKDLRKAMAFLLEWPQYLTPCGVVEFISLIMPVAAVLELQASLLKVQFSGLLYMFNPLLCHAFLGLFSRFLDAFDGQENEVIRRLILVTKESQHHLVFRLLALHWLLGIIGLLPGRKIEKKKAIIDMSLNLYPRVFDPLALKSLKLDLLAYCSILLQEAAITSGNVIVESEACVQRLFEDGLLCVSAFKWLPPWSTETAVAFRAFHNFLIGASSHSDTASSSTKGLVESSIFCVFQMVVNLTIDFRSLVPVIVYFINRLLGCHKHRLLGERLLQAFDEHLLPKLSLDHRLGAYVPLFERIAENDTVPPSGLLKLLIKFMVILVQKHGPDVRLKSWSQGSKILCICRIMLMHHHSSRLFIGLYRLLAFTCLYFPDLEVRDNARIYLRMLVCIPGKKLKSILNTGGQLPGISPSPHPGSFFGVQSPRPSRDLKKSRNISSYIHIDRIVPLLVKQSWSLSLSNLGINGTKPCYLEAIRDGEFTSEQEADSSKNIDFISPTEIVDKPQEPLRVTDSKISEVVGILRSHFSSIPDFRHMRGLRVRISCTLGFKSEPFNQIWRVDLPANGLDGLNALPALYAIALTFSSSAPYGFIPSGHIPFLLGEPPEHFYSSNRDNSLDIVPLGNDYREEEEFKAPVTIELEPREPVPGVIDVSIDANTENSQIIQGQLQSINVGIEDMFLKAIVPDEVPDDALPDYYVDLFNALWEACGASSSTGRETFYLKGGKGVAAISGTRSVKLLEIPVAFVIKAVERYLAPFVVSVIGESLVNMVKVGGIIRNIIWKDVDSDSDLDITTMDNSFNRSPLYLKYTNDEDERRNLVLINRKNMGCMLILIFLPPRYHLLFQMEVSNFSTLVRIRTDHWPCLAYLDDYLEVLFSTKQ